MKQNNHLKELFIHDNDFTNIGREALSKAVYDPSSINAVYDCNHTCQIETGVWDLSHSCTNSSIANPRTKRKDKIHYILSLRHREGSNVLHLNAEFDEDGDKDSTSLKIVPKVLESIHKYSKYHIFNVHCRLCMRSYEVGRCLTYTKRGVS